MADRAVDRVAAQLSRGWPRCADKFVAAVRFRGRSRAAMAFAADDASTFPCACRGAGPLRTTLGHGHHGGMGCAWPFAHDPLVERRRVASVRNDRRDAQRGSTSSALVLRTGCAPRTPPRTAAFVTFVAFGPCSIGRALRRPRGSPRAGRIASRLDRVAGLAAIRCDGVAWRWRGLARRRTFDGATKSGGAS